MPEQRKAKIIRVHGTFAGNEYQESSWYTDDSSFGKDLEKRLDSETFDLADEFNWGGNNLFPASTTEVL